MLAETGGMEMDSAYFAGGCFWCITPVFAEMDGVARVTSGYCGGTEDSAVYAKVKSQQTAHRETIRIDYDSSAVSYRALLDRFLASVDPYDAGGQFIDRGRSYTLAVYFCSDSERRQALAALDALEQASGRTPCVCVEPFCGFYEAEEEHQDFYRKNPEAFRQELIDSGRSGLVTLL